MIKFFTTIGGFLLGSLLVALLVILSFNPNFFATKMLENKLRNWGATPTNQLDRYLDRILIEDILSSPERLSYMGLDELDMFTGHNSRWDDYSQKSSQKSYEETIVRLSTLEKFDENKLQDEKFNLQIAKFSLKNQKVSYESFQHHFNPLSQFFGLHLNLVEFLTDTHKITDEKSVKNYIDRVSAIDDVINESILFLREREKKGIYSPKFVYKKAKNQIEALASLELIDNPIYKNLNEKIETVEIDDGLKKLYLNQLEAALSNTFIKSYQNLASVINEQLLNARTTDGVWALPNGQDFYKHRLKIYTTTDYSPEEIHEIGLKLVSEIQTEIINIFENEGYDTTQPLPFLYDELNNDPRFLFEDSDQGRRQIIEKYTEIQVNALTEMGSYFHQLPKAEVIVKRIPEYAEASAAGGYYQSPALDGSRPGIFYANLYDIKATKKFGMPALSFHEAIPGHHFQNALNQENQNQTIWKKLGYRTSAFGEGWALYSERLAIEAGLINDPYEMIGSLQSELFRAVRLVVDTGIHYKKWTREEAIKYMMENVGSEESEATSEIERYIVWPGQACAYMIGQIKILELREKAQNELGNRYDIRDFHHHVLMNGSLPLTVLEAIIDKYIQEVKAN
ncbi:MAG: DUF885 domain-containing protein [SAR86 cluster bacterium]|nr:DUF885 domain-containing protein [SAR86 cluster bacterium]MDA0900112.1 DUF885 domain-containing protein [Pseudomonadota bacterium]